MGKYEEFRSTGEPGITGEVADGSKVIVMHFPEKTRVFNVVGMRGWIKILSLMADEAERNGGTCEMVS